MMKKTNSILPIILVLLTTPFFSSNLLADNDSLFLRNDSCLMNKLDTCEANAVEVLPYKNTAEHIVLKKQLKKFSIIKQKHNKGTKPAGFFDWLDEAWEFLQNLRKPVWGHYEEHKFRSEGPYFLFDRQFDGNTYLIIQMDRLRDKIKIIGGKERDIYKAVFEAADSTIIENCKGVLIPNPGDGSTQCPSAARAKASAFIYLVGLDGFGSPLSQASRNGYRDRALAYLRDVKAQGLNNTYDYISWIPMMPNVINLYSNILASTSNWSQYFWRAKELQLICEAWDMLRWCYNVDPTLPNDGLIRTRLNEAAQRIKDNYVVPLHRRAQYGMYKTQNNYALVAGAALASAAICFHDYGTYIFLFDTRPARWANSAYYNIHKTMWRDGLVYGNKMSKPGNTYGYAEGTHYFMSAFENLIPMFLARYNFSTADVTKGYNSFTFDPDPHYVRNFWHDPDYHNLYEWYNNLIQPDGTHPTIDDTWAGNEFNGALAILRKSGGKQYNFQVNSSQLRELKEDYLAALTPPVKIELPEAIQMASGDIVVRSRPIDEANGKGKHYIHINAEKESAPKGGWHEHDGDFGSFIIMADNDLLMMDPPLFSDAKNEIKKPQDHNTLSIGAGDFMFPTNTSGVISKNLAPDQVNPTVKLKFEDLAIGKWERTFVINRESEDLGYHYVVVDEVSNNILPLKFNFNFNGNGEQSTHSVPPDSNYIDWTHPCTISSGNGRWGLRARFSVSGDVSKSYALINDAKHNGIDGDIDPNICYPLPGKDYRHHTRYTVGIVPNYSLFSLPSPFSLQTILQPKRCINFNTVGRTFTRSAERYGLSLIYDDDTIKPRMVYISKHTNEPDTIQNPFNIHSNAVLKTNAKVTYFHYGEDSVQQHGYCPAYARFRSGSIYTGDSLVFNDTAYIKTTVRSDAFYRLVGKYKYQGTINCDSLDSVRFYLPDLDTNFRMAAIGKNIQYQYNDTTHVMTVIAQPGFSSFIIQMEDPCVMNCYFPTAIDSIKSTFNYNTGIPEQLPYKLTITTPNGYLKINSGSHMSICPGKWLRNKDSLIMEGPCPIIGKKGTSICPDPTKGAVISSMDNDPKSEITVKEYAALILDSGSYTRFGNNTRINILPYGSLIIRKNAKVDIGDEKGCGYAQIICHPNSYVHFEDSADIQFWKIPDDTSDIHLFYIALKPSRNAAQAGIEPSMAQMLMSVDAIPVGNAASICNIQAIKPDWGINNRDWGFANFAYPKAWAYINKDTFCPGECPLINFDRMLNDVKRNILFCRIDTDYTQNPAVAIFDSCIYPTFKGSSYNGDGCDTLQYLPPAYICHPLIDDPGKWYRITLTSTNDCDQSDQVHLYYYNQPALKPDFSLTQSSCTGSDIRGYEMGDTYTNTTRETTRWHVHLIDTTKSLTKPGKSYGADWEYSKATYPDTFDFPGFKWYGGFKYAVAHTVGTPICGDTTAWDTVEVIGGAYIQLSSPRVYGTNISGNTSIQLTAHTPMADSFTWSPTTWLNRSDTSVVISTPQDSIDYILTAYIGTCIAYDTAHIKYNIYANAGVNDTLCFDSTHTPEVLLGFPYDMSLFIGMLYYFDREEPGSSTVCTQNFMSTYQTHNSSNATDYFKYFTHFMHTAAFANAVPTLYDQFVNDLDKNLFFKHANYKNYYKNFTAFNDPYMSMLNGFVSWIDNNATLKTEMSRLNAWCGIYSNLDQLLTDYDYFVANNTADISASWSKIAGNDTTALTSYNNLFVAVDNPTKTSKYILTSITPTKAEIDEITIIVDTLLSTAFSPALQFDSTVYFQSFVEPYSKALSYHWNFGDGTSSTEKHPIHTFPAFDSNYVVCLTVTNTCSSFSFCDTVRIDSAHLGGGLAIRKNIPFYESDNKQSSSTNKQKSANSYQPTTINQQLSLSNYPNPFDNNTIIAYEIWENFEQAELKITNVLGQAVFVKKLDRPIDKIEINGQVLPNGIYYYSIVLDGAVKQTKSMSVIH